MPELCARVPRSGHARSVGRTHTEAVGSRAAPQGNQGDPTDFGTNVEWTMRPEPLDVVLELRREASGLSLRAAEEIGRLRQEIARLRMNMGPVTSSDPLVKWENR
jgi:hypothetical protein